jgi:hypothetical protein
MTIKQLEVASLDPVKAIKSSDLKLGKASKRKGGRGMVFRFEVLDSPKEAIKKLVKILGSSSALHHDTSSTWEGVGYQVMYNHSANDPSDNTVTIYTSR